MQAASFLPAVVVAGLLGTFSIPPSPPQDPARGRAGDFVLEAGKHNVKDLIDRAAAYLGRNYVYSEIDFANAADLEVTLQNRLVLDATACEEVLSELAFTKGFVMFPIDEKRGLYEWVYRMGPKRAEVSSYAVEMTPEQVLRKRYLRIPVRTTYPLQELNSTNVVNQLRPFLMAGNPAGVGLVVGSAGNAILLQGFTHEVATAVEMIEKLEGPAPELEPGLSTWKARVDKRLDDIERQLRQR